MKDQEMARGMYDLLYDIRNNIPEFIDLPISSVLHYTDRSMMTTSLTNDTEDGERDFCIRITLSPIDYYIHSEPLKEMIHRDPMFKRMLDYMEKEDIQINTKSIFVMLVLMGLGQAKYFSKLEDQTLSDISMYTLNNIKDNSEPEEFTGLLSVLHPAFVNGYLAVAMYLKDTINVFGTDYLDRIKIV